MASGVTAFSSVGLMTRTPRPFICSKSTRLLTERMNITTSMGLMSVPVAIMSTVTAMRGSKELRNAWIRFDGLSAVVRYVIFWQKSLPLPNSLRTIPTMSSAWLSSLAKIKVFGTFSRCGNASGKKLSLKARTTVRIWSGATTWSSRSVPA